MKYSVNYSKVKATKPKEAEVCLFSAIINQKVILFGQFLFLSFICNYINQNVHT